jgi:hypothetical protein
MAHGVLFTSLSGLAAATPSRGHGLLGVRVLSRHPAREGQRIVKDQRDNCPGRRLQPAAAIDGAGSGLLRAADGTGSA